MSSIIYLFITSFILASASPSHQYCYPPTKIQHGFVEIIDHTYYTFSCEYGYSLHGQRHILCNEYSQMREKPNCIKRHFYSEPDNHNSGVRQRTSLRNSDFTTNNYNSFSRRKHCENLHCEQLCLFEKGVPRCKCCAGYILEDDRMTCRVKNEARINMNECLRKYRKVGDVELRSCPEGYTFDYVRKGCTDINECAFENRCQHYCNNTEGSFFCSCKPGYILIEGYKCEGCRRNSYWSYEKNACVDCPKNSHTDSESKTTIKDCKCDSGYSGSPGDYIACEDIDECSINNFNCSDECSNIPGDAYCLCPKGFVLDTDNKTCIDINECTIQNGGCEGICINSEGSFNCFCPEGFTSSSRDRYSCDDIDECSENNGGCGHICNNYRGGFYCSCRTGYHLDSTLRNCSSYIQCPKLPQPHYSHTMDCKYENVLLPEKSNYPAGTECIFKCFRGFKIAQGTKQVICQEDGTWEGTLPECKPESCPPLKVPENGKVHPPTCSKHGATIKQKCAFSCNAGYILEGFPVFTCKNSKRWDKNEVPVCNPVKIEPLIKCPDDIRVVLLQGTAKHNITVPEPLSNTEHYEVNPSWVTINEPVQFPVGVTQVTFTGISTFNETAQCEMTITVLDEEPPVFHFCPDPIIIEDAKGNGEFVTWDEPVVTDNVELISVFSLMKPNITLTPGTYFVEYVARDSSGNIGTCSFHISIARTNCSGLGDPDHGKANCMDWMFGKFCNPECDNGYMRDPEEPLYFSCDDIGIWEPSDFISECLQYTPASSSTCQDGFELKKVDVPGEEVCIECSSNAVWSSLTRKCEK